MTTKSVFNKSALVLAGVVITSAGGNVMAEQDKFVQAELTYHAERVEKTSVNLDSLKDAAAGEPLDPLAKQLCLPAIAALGDSERVQTFDELTVRMRGMTVDPTGLDEAQARTRARIEKKCIPPSGP